jgi:hypothetical protein
MDDSMLTVTASKLKRLGKLQKDFCFFFFQECCFKGNVIDIARINLRFFFKQVPDKSDMPVISTVPLANIQSLNFCITKPQLLNQDLWILQLLGSQPQTPHCSSSHEGKFNISKPSILSKIMFAKLNFVCQAKFKILYEGALFDFTKVIF